MQGFGTGWCIAGAITAQDYINRGDFYVFYSKDKKGKDTVPRAAISVTDLGVTEVRGVLPGQNLEPEMTEIVQQQLEELPQGDKYFHKVSDMRRVTALEQQMTHGQPPTPEDLRFLYELDREIEGFGHEKDPRIAPLQERSLEHPDTLRLFDEASSDPDEKVRNRAVLIMLKHPDLFVGPLTKLAEEKDKEVYYDVIKVMGQRADLFVGPLTKLAEDTDEDVSCFVVDCAIRQRPDLFVGLLTKLVEDTDKEVFKFALSAMGQRPDLFVETLTKLAEDTDKEVLKHVLSAMRQRPDLFVGLLTKLAEDEDSGVIEAAIMPMRDRPDLFVDTLTKLAAPLIHARSEGNSRQREAVWAMLKRPELFVETLSSIMRQSGYTFAREIIAKEVARQRPDLFVAPLSDFVSRPHYRVRTEVINEVLFFMNRRPDLFPKIK